MITEGPYIDDQTSQGYFFQPGIANAAQSAAWRRVVDGVHAAGAKFFAQLMHAGSQSQGNSHTNSTWGPSAVRPKGEQLGMYRGSGPFQTPQAMTAEHICQTSLFLRRCRHGWRATPDSTAWRSTARTAISLDAFLTEYMNTRTDDYGGSVANRVRLAAEVCSDVVAAVGDDIAVGIRISQGKVSDNNHRWAGGEDDAAVIFPALAATGIDFVHTTEYRALAAAFAGGDKTLAALAKQHCGLSVIVNGSLDDPRDAARIIETGDADVVALGKPALANRDWPIRVKSGQPLAPDLPGSLLGPIADVKDWEIANIEGLGSSE